MPAYYLLRTRRKRSILSPASSRKGTVPLFVVCCGSLLGKEADICLTFSDETY